MEEQKITERLHTKVTLVTGGGSGIGEAIRKQFAEEGATVFVTDIDLESAQRVAAEISAAGGSAVARKQDVTDPDTWDTLLAGIVEELGRLGCSAVVLARCVPAAHVTQGCIDIPASRLGGIQGAQRSGYSLAGA